LAGGGEPAAGIGDVDLSELISIDLERGGALHFVIVHTRQLARCDRAPSPTCSRQNLARTTRQLCVARQLCRDESHNLAWL
jgi:hypothetical protein